ncbi:hypothetical protein [Undibacterium danionis]|uniref:Replication-relaxation n=1 Tax=Undibacterium danionis TaxID=1812100 RepID=A0ABV6IHK8_9BURK
MKKNHLTKNGTEVREFYLVEALKLVQRYGVVRAHTLAFGLFPNRTQKAATAAAQRVLGNATEAGYLRAKDDFKTRRRYYALSVGGARYLNEVAPECPAKGRQTLLEHMSRANHRDWGILIAMASNMRAHMVGVTEDQLWAKLRNETLDYFGHVPDVLTFYTNGTGKRIAVWHEVEASRRSRTASYSERARAKSIGKTARSGMDQLRDLLKQLRSKRFVTYEHQEYTVALVMHCATGKIEREIRCVIKDFFSKEGVTESDDVYSVAFNSAKFGDLVISINRLPEKVECTWIDTFGMPWPNAPTQIMTALTHQYLAHK